MSSDTLFWAASTAKGVSSSLAHVLVERGELDYDMKAVMAVMRNRFGDVAIVAKIDRIVAEAVP